MPDWAYSNGHIGWMLFVLAVFTSAGVFVPDDIWCGVTAAPGLLFAEALGGWLLCVRVSSRMF